MPAACTLLLNAAIQTVYFVVLSGGPGTEICERKPVLGLDNQIPGGAKPIKTFYTKEIQLFNHWKSGNFKAFFMQTSAYFVYIRKQKMADSETKGK